MIMSTKFDIEKYDGMASFALWQVRMMAILSNQGAKAAIFGQDKSATKMENKDSEMMDDIALSTIQLCLSDSTL